MYIAASVCSTCYNRTSQHIHVYVHNIIAKHEAIIIYVYWNTICRNTFGGPMQQSYNRVDLHLSMGFQNSVMTIAQGHYEWNIAPTLVQWEIDNAMY